MFCVYVYFDDYRYRVFQHMVLRECLFLGSNKRLDK